MQPSTPMDLADLVERSAALMATLDAAGQVQFLNGRCEEACGIDRLAASGRPWVELFICAEERAAVACRLEKARNGRPVAAFTACLPPCDGNKARLIRWQLTELRPSVLCATGIDVTDEQDAAARSRRTERIAALGTMTAGLAHELRNPLNAAHLQLDLARRRLVRGPDPVGALAAVDIANSEVSRLARLVDEFLVFARPDPLHLCPGDLRPVAEASVESLRAEASARSVELALEDGEPVRAEFDDVRMSQAIQHLVRNALEANEVGGRVKVALRSGTGEVVILIEDSGRGLPAGAPVFEPFYTTKAQGTGLGLAIVHRIVSDHGGSIAVESSPGHTLFAVSLPAA